MLRPPSWLVLALVTAVCVGVLLRTLQFAARVSLSGDESFLALNVAGRDLGELVSRLDFNQVAPILFLLLDKLSVVALGREEVALRLVPFVASIIALGAFAVLAARALPAVGAVVATGMLAVSEPTITWAAMGKQYSSDVLATTLVLLAAVSVARAPASRSRLVMLGLVGTVVVWLAYPSAFVLAGAGVALIAAAARRRDVRGTASLVVASAVWGLSFLLSYHQTQSGINGLQTSLDSDPTAFIGGDGGAWYDGVPGVTRYVTGAPHQLLLGMDAGDLVSAAALVLAAYGALALLRRAPLLGAMLVLPIALALGAVLLHQYPLLPRAALWSIPILCLLVGRGFAALAEGDAGTSRRPALGIALGLLLIPLALPAAGHAFHPRKTQQMRQLLDGFAKHWQRHDAVYVYYSAQYGLRWYLTCGCAGATVDRARTAGFLPVEPARDGPYQWAPTMRSVPPDLAIGTYLGSDETEYSAEIRKELAGRPRAWLLISNIRRQDRAGILADLERRGAVRRATVSVDGDESAAAAYLYDFTGVARSG